MKRFGWLQRLRKFVDRRRTSRVHATRPIVEALEARALPSASVFATLVKDVNPGVAGSFPENLTALGSTVYFTTTPSSTQSELWKTDGTSDGTALIQSLSAAGGITPIANLTVMDGKLYFTADDGFLGNELWTLDPVTDSTSVIDINPGQGASDPTDVTVFNHALYFAADGGDGAGTELWRFNGTTATRVADIVPGAKGSLPDQLTPIGNLLYFTINDGAALYQTDGLSTHAVSGIPIGSSGTTFSSLTNLDGVLYFMMLDPSNGAQLWKTSTVGGSHSIKNFGTAAIDNYPYFLTPYDHELFFTVDDGVHGRELWSYDGVNMPTGPVADINPGADASYPWNLTVSGGRLYFSAYDPDHGHELWMMAGVHAAPQLVADLNTGTDDSLPWSETDVNGVLYFTADDGTHGVELFRDDGIFLTQVQDINIGLGSSNPDWLTNVNGTLYFSAADGVIGAELWQTTPVASPGQFEFSTVSPETSESDGQITLAIVRTGGNVGPADVDFNLDGGTAIAGHDYIANSQTLHFAAGQASQTITIIIPGDNAANGDKTLNMSLSDPTGGATLGADHAAVLTIQDTLHTVNQHYVAEVYLDVLGRPADRGSLLYWANSLDHGLPRSAFVSALTHSVEYLSNIVEPAYEKFLGRQADDDGLNYWIGQMQDGMTDEELEAAFIGSAEYYQYTGGADGSWVDAMYQNLLGRSPDSGGHNYWVTMLANGADRSVVAFGFAASAEREGMAVQDDYQRFLARTASTAEVGYWVNAFRHGMTNELVVTGFASSNEYFHRMTGT